MRRRRFPGRPRRRPIFGLSRRRLVPPKLREANRLYQSGDFKGAAGLYAEMAQRAEMNGLPQAANLYLRAGIAALKLEDLAQTEKLLEQALAYCVEHKRWPQLRRILNVIAAELDAAGQTELKDRLFARIKEQLPGAADVQPAGDERDKNAVALPAHCPNCGGPVNPKEVEWFDAANPVCAFCGSVLSDD
ncbi:MAG: hypothetical protein PWQ55_435 [Chloroflexota bacterium]|nr:hypothetical protein [Chloroflexota bacterium]